MKILIQQVFRAIPFCVLIAKVNGSKNNLRLNRLRIHSGHKDIIATPCFILTVSGRGQYNNPVFSADFLPQPVKQFQKAPPVQPRHTNV
jgi:hypothetical protein